MELQELVEQIADNGFKEEYYGFTLFLPRAMLGQGRKYEMYLREEERDTKPWGNGDCSIPVKHVEGALVEKVEGVMAEVSFIMPLEELTLFAENLWDALKDFNFDVKVKVSDDVTVGD